MASSMEQLKSVRKALRTSISLTINAAERLLEKDDSTQVELNANKQRILDKFNRLTKTQEELDLLFLASDEQSYIDDFQKAETYRDKVIDIIALLDDRITSNNRIDKPKPSITKMKLPEVKLESFDGNPRNFLKFWTQFKRIDEEEQMAEEEKFIYLRQCMIKNSKAARLIESFPPSKENYRMAVDNLKERFGKPAMLTQIYVRDLLSLMLQNATSKSKIDIAELYDAIENKLLALESLDQPQETHAMFLEPMVESCLPEITLRAWERYKRQIHEESDDKYPLKRLMMFLRTEVESEEHIKLTRSSFGINKMSVKIVPEDMLPTCADLINMESTPNGDRFKTKRCIFCDKVHESMKCERANKLSVDERYHLVKIKNACLKCLLVGHYANKCKSKIKCMKCNGNHCSLLCNRNIAEANVKERAAADAVHATVACNKIINNMPLQVYLQTLIIKLQNRNRICTVRALVDSASQRSYISHQAIHELQLKPIAQQKLVHTVFGGKETPALMHQVYRIKGLSTVNGYCCNLKLWSQEKICGTIPKLTDTEVIQELRDKQIIVPDLLHSHEDVDVLLGADILGKLLTNTEKNIVLDCGLLIIHTKFGYSFLGSAHKFWKSNKTHQTDLKDEAFSTTMFVQPHCISDLWRLETLGIVDPIEQSRTRNVNRDNMQQYNDDKLSRLSDGRFELNLPFKDSNRPYVDKTIVRSRHVSMCRRLDSKGLLDQYKQVFDEWELLKIIERVPDNELDTPGFYLPHRPVFKESSLTTKIRPVFNASMRIKNRVSLNDCLITGPNLIEDIPDIIDRFRIYPIGLTSDIEKAYLQLSIHPKDRNFLRFFNPAKNNYPLYRHCRLVFGLTSSPFMLATALHNLLDSAPNDHAQTAQKLKHSFYVDNCVTGVFSMKEQELFVTQSTELMRRGRFHLRDWISNVASPLVSQNAGDANVLGLIWDLDHDTLRCKIDFPRIGAISKRKILSIVQQVYDPIGLLSPYTLIPKLMLQKLWNKKLTWDEPIPPEVSASFNYWCEQMNLMKNIRVPRYIALSSNSELLLCVDACQTSYAACVFLVNFHPSGNVVHLMRAKTRVAPLKPATIPRLELMSCTIGARLVQSVQRALDMSNLKVSAWSDSMVSLWWIKTEGPWSVFVANRVKEINQLIPSKVWQYVPGNMNPADLLSRGCMPGKGPEGMWWNKIEWSLLPRDSWPKNDIFCDELEVKRERRKIVLSNVVTEKSDIPWYARKFSCYRMIIRMIAWILRFLHNSRPFNRDKRRRGILSPEEETQGELVLIKYVQQTELKPKLDSLKLEVFEDYKGIYRVKTRITERSDNYDFTCPILLSDKSLLSLRLIEYFHKINLHAGTHMLLSIIREQFWILKAMRVIRKIVKKCAICNRYVAKCLKSIPVPLPADRVSSTAIFEIIGIDLAGPLYLKKGGKAWIVLFTCAVYRAVHLELITALSTEIFLLALRRFIARRGRPHTIYSDNGTNFQCASRELAALNWGKILESSDAQKIIWKFIPPTAAWWGGWWERIIRMIKELLRRSLGRSILLYEELNTILCSCEAILNSRPLTYISDNLEDLKPLTPAMFLNDHKSYDVTDLNEIDTLSLNRRVKYRLKLIKDLQQRFRREYLGLLIQARNAVGVPQIKQDDVVFIGDERKKRFLWTLARVQEIYPGKDGVIRTVKLKTQNGSITRPIQRIYPLEATSENVTILHSAEKVCPTVTCPSITNLELIKTQGGEEDVGYNKVNMLKESNNEKMLTMSNSDLIHAFKIIKYNSKIARK